MAGRLLDTVILIEHWHECRSRSRNRGQNDAIRWAKDLVRKEGTNAVATPVIIEFLAGVSSRDELALARAFLSQFVAIDRGRINASDWKEAERIASRVPSTGKRRQLGDCLIRAIANRLHYDVITRDPGFPR
jgi:predicted nucleic acid-binding protein